MKARETIFGACITCLLGAFLLAGCQQGTGISTNVRSTGAAASVGYEIEEQSPELSRLVKVKQAAAQKVNGLWQAQVEVRSIAQQSFTLEYRFTWRDAQGFAQPSLLDAWRDLTLAPGETVPLQSVTSSPVAAHYVFSIRLRQ